MKKQFTQLKDRLLVRAPAKLNLSLLISRKRPDGYHEIETVMAKVDWYDELLFEPGEPGRIELVCKGPRWAPQGRENLVYKACKMLYDSIGVQPGIKVTLTKNIPAGSGLGGASSDAAAALLGLNRFAQLGAGFDNLFDIAVCLGSDVPFFLSGPLALCKGKGEKIEEFFEEFFFQAIIVLPLINVSTKRVYENYVHNQRVYDKFSREINKFVSEKNIDLLTKICANMLQESSFQLNEQLADLKARIESAGIGPVRLSGSGSAMYCLFGSEDQNVKHYKSLLNEIVGCESKLVHNNRW